MLDCNVGGNREVVVAADPVVEHFCYNQCGAECIVDPAAADITFRVNMFTTGASAAGVWMIGGFSDMNRHRNPKKIGFWMWFWIFKSKIKIKPKNPKNQKTTSKTKP